MAILSRLDNWPERLEKAIKAVLDKEFRWGKQDCCLVTFDLVNAITGQNLFPFHGFYESPEGLLELGRAEFGGVKSPEELADYLLGGDIDPATARTGDVLCFEKGKWNSIGTLTAMGVMFRGYDGMIFMSPARCKRAWKVG